MGYFPDVFDTDHHYDFVRTTTLDGEEVEYYDSELTDRFSTHEFHRTNIDNHVKNWPKRARKTNGNPFRYIKVRINRAFKTPPKPTPISTQVATVLESAQENIDQFIEDRLIDFDKSELEHGIDQVLAEASSDIQVKQKHPQLAYEEDTLDVNTVLEELEPA